MVAISIISPSLNQKRFVQQTLDSIASQDFRDYEHLVFDGRSTDGTLEVLKKAAAADSRMSLQIGRDTSQANAINLGLREARGDILTWLNTDDFYVNASVLSEVSDLFARNPDADVIYGRGRFVAPDGKVLRDTYINDEPERLRCRFINSNGILQPALFFRSSVLERFGELDESMGCAFDYEYWVRLIAGGARFAFLDKVLVHAIWHDDMKTSKTRGQSFEESIEVVRRHYGFSPMDWVERLSGFVVAGSDFVMTDKGKDSPKIRKKTKRHAEKDFRRRNDSAAAKSAILRWAHAPETAKSLVALRRASGMDWARVIVTTFNEPYFEQGLTLIASLHRTGTRGTPILVYDLGLTDWQRGHIATLRDVFVLDYPRDIAPDYPEFFEPKSYVYKILALDHAASIVEPKGAVLFIDAGVAVVEGVEPLFDRIAQDGVFFVDHDDKAVLPLRNETFATDDCIEGMDATNDELVGIHLCSCLMGCGVGGRFRPLFSEALSCATNPRVALGDKHPAPADQTLPAASVAQRQRAVDDQAFRSKLSRAEMRRLFGYLGHRQDQTILSILAARHGAPISSARAYCISNEASSDASKKNWAARGRSLTIKSSREAESSFQRSVTIHHRGLYVNLEYLDFGVPHAAPAIVLGNGPSLKGFDFGRFKPFDVFGMNAAYRYWDEIGWYPKCYSCLDLVVGMSHADEIARLIRKAPEYGIERFLLRRSLINHIGPIENSDRLVDFDLLRKGTRQFSRLPITTGSHTLIWAAALGYRDIYVMGADCNYVELVPGAERREGTALEITAAAGENPNYFFAGYQQVGDKYNVPNSSPDLHIESWRAAAIALRDFGVTALNANLQSRIDAFDFCRFEDIEKGGRVPVIPRRKIVGEAASYAPTALASVPFEQSESAQIDESALVLSALSPTARKGVMIDVGAHHGGSLKPFAKVGWTVHAFEPDPKNREKLVNSYGSKENVIISEDAVSDVGGQIVPFYASEESAGISGLSAFRESHKEVARVSTTTLNEIVARHSIAAIDFLKIDVEGFEMAVLRGLDFDRLKPLSIMAEFEDFKTEGAGYASHDMARFLLDRGYHVYVSEWHPIERYGVRHSFRRIQQYPCSIPSNSWGNLLAFKTDPEPDALKRAIRASVDRPVAFVGEAEPEPLEQQPVAGVSVAPSKAPTDSPPVEAAGDRASEAARGGGAGPAAAKPASGATAGRQVARSRSNVDLTRRVSALWANWTRPMRRRPIISAFLWVALVTLLTFPLSRPFLSTLATPEFIVALLAANIVLTALVARIVRKSLISRIRGFAARSEDELRRSEARQQSSIKGQLQDLEGRIVAALQTLAPATPPDSDELAAKIAGRLAEAHRPDVQADIAVENRHVDKADPVAGQADLRAAHGNGANGGSDLRPPQSSPTQEAASEDRHSAVDPRPASDNQTHLRD